MTQALQVKVIKRYANRKLYDTETSKYTTLKEIVTMVANGREMQVVDNVSNEDITGTTLLSAIVETEQDLATSVPTLIGILQAGGLAKYVETLKNGANN